jgi:hypothetical protein
MPYAQGWGQVIFREERVQFRNFIFISGFVQLAAALQEIYEQRAYGCEAVFRLVKNYGIIGIYDLVGDFLSTGCGQAVA